MQSKSLQDLEKESIYKHEPQNLAMMLLMNISGALWRIQFKKWIPMKSCIPSLIRDQS